MNLENLTTHTGEPVTLNAETVLKAIKRLKELKPVMKPWSLEEAMLYATKQYEHLPIHFVTSA